ncbi:MAG: hypothetical protein IKF14_05580 [Atopobiaceae bacterium]|nr:hypothetical protein [Atopobiaceae bacterium]
MSGVKDKLRKLAGAIQDSPPTVPAYYTLGAFHAVRARSFGRPRIAEADIKNVEENLTFIFKSFNRQGLARQAYRSIRSYYPHVRIIIADDSEVPLEIDGAEIVHLPFTAA